MMHVAEKLMTVEEFARLPNDGKKYELVEGKRVECYVSKPIQTDSTVHPEKHALANYFPTGHDLAVEIVSEFDTPAEIDKKVNEYLAAGAKLVWVVYPDAKRVGIYDDDGHYKGLDINGVLDGGQVVPGFSMALKDIFRD
jgi:Uma2 family endonuclease